jgi:hypothetical protein
LTAFQTAALETLYSFASSSPLNALRGAEISFTSSKSLSAMMITSLFVVPPNRIPKSPHPQGSRKPQDRVQWMRRKKEL